MKVQKVSQDALFHAAKKVGIEIYNFRPSGKGFAFRLVPKTNWYRALSKQYGKWRRKNAVCFHGHYAFMKYIYAMQPEAVFISTFHGTVRYESITDLRIESKKLRTQNVGSQADPITFEEACTCGRAFEFEGANHEATP